MASIDLRDDAKEIRQWLKDAVGRYVALHQASATAGQHPPVTRIDLAYSLGDSESTPWVHLYFDTKPGSEPDGAPTHPDFATLPRPRWLPAVQADCEGEEVIIESDSGSQACEEGDLHAVIGMFLVSALLDAKTSGIFAPLPRDAHCELGVEDPSTGEFGWPNYDDRGQQNLV
jgi:hypothetical protein